ncbi:HAMP domain-containing protein [Nocardia brasiliensis]|uniref:histidine kinase n=1 Tax=Nocardia brasiliensis TaxID=37326 RepID=A0A6G9XTQ7_NOCBR|nr:HAMP domain-containing protein [Nocardia brasiliensis]
MTESEPRRGWLSRATRAAGSTGPITSIRESIARGEDSEVGAERRARRHWPTEIRSVRGRVVLAFALSASLVSLFLVLSVFTIGRGYMQAQRERTVERIAGAHAQLLHARLAVPGTSAPQALSTLTPTPDTVLALRWNSEWHVTDSGAEPELLPLVQTSGTEPLPAERIRLHGNPYLRAGAQLDESGGILYEFAPLTELEATLRALRTLLILCAIAATAIGAALGVWASRRALKPLHQVAGAAARISSGELGLRLPRTHDRDLATTVDAFNGMLDSLQQRIDRERRLVADIGHELRTPLTTLTTSVGVMARHRDELPERPRMAFGLISAELEHLRRLLDDLLALARAEAGIHRSQPEPLSLRELVTYTLAGRKFAPELLTVAEDVSIDGRKIELERAIANLLDNADRHGGGLTEVTVARDGRDALIHIDDAGPGVPEGDRERIFERFVTAKIGRRTGTGTGIGLALVAETVAAHHGSVTCTDRPGGGARFVVRLPVTGTHPSHDDKAADEAPRNHRAEQAR